MSDFILDPSVNNVFTSGATVTPEVVATRAPTSADNQYNVGTFWFYSDSVNSVFKLYAQQGFSAGVPQWELIASSSGAVVAVNGTTSQITATTSAGVVTLTLPTSLLAPGSVTATTTLTATLGAITATNGNLVLGTAGNKLQIATGSNASLGTSSALSSGTVTVSTTAVTASSKIFLTRAVAGGTLGNLSVGTITAGTSFTITSDNASDTSTVNYLIVN